MRKGIVTNGKVAQHNCMTVDVNISGHCNGLNVAATAQ